MEYRVILRVSLNRDAGSAVRNTLAQTLQAAGLENSTTGTWESASCDLDTAVACLAEVFGHLEGLDDEMSAHLDHLWVYMDRAES